MFVKILIRVQSTIKIRRKTKTLQSTGTGIIPQPGGKQFDISAGITG